ncbi:metallophosphoesterase family protein [Blastomonas fulva]|jgi:serine/threonine protein phosphatase 1|uniref:metallophosphoesterase family protein n=1 Tax=Blastomonas fulva TaxID=1550728 RepID=UPI003D2D749E
MLKALLRRKPKPSAPIDTARLPDGRRVYAIGDVHGRRDLLDQLLDQIVADDRERGAADTHIVFLGDLMDRGPDSSGVIDRAIEVSQSLGENAHFLMGNHEEVYLGAASGDEKLVRFFCKIGGRETILSYDITPQDYNELSMEELAARMPALLTRRHVDFVSGFKDRIVMGDYAFVHAGVRPGVPIEDQRPKDLRWIREDFIMDEAPHDKLIVHGHTITDDVEECPNRIGIDTGAYMSGMLTALCLEGGERWYLKTGQ